MSNAWFGTLDPKGPLTPATPEPDDPDEIEEITGALVSETAQLWNLTLPDDTRVTSFPKFTPSGVKVWRRA